MADADLTGSPPAPAQPDVALSLESPLYWLTALPAWAIIVIGVRFLLRPEPAALGFGIAASGSAAAYGRVKGIRDVVSGLLVLAALRRGRRDEVASLLGIATLTPLGDLLLVWQYHGAADRQALAIHGGTALYMAVVTALLVWRPRSPQLGTGGRTADRAGASST